MNRKTRNTRGQLRPKDTLSNAEKRVGSLFIEHYHYVYQYVHTKVKYKNDVEDIVQETFLRLINGNIPVNPRRYVCGIANHVIYHYFAEKAKRPRIVRDEFLNEVKCMQNKDSGRFVLEYQYGSKQLLEKMNCHLTKIHFEAIRLRFLEELSNETAAQKRVSGL